MKDNVNKKNNVNKNEMADNKKESLSTYEDIKNAISALKCNGKDFKNDYNKVVNLFCSVKNVKEIDKAEIEDLLNISRKKVGNSEWRLLLDVFGRYFLKDGYKNRDKVLYYTKSACYELLKSGVSADDIKNSLLLIGTNEGSKKYQNWLNDIKIDNLDKKAYIGLIYILTMFEAHDIFGSEFDKKIGTVMQVFFENYASSNGRDAYFVEQITKAFKDDKYAELFNGFTYLSKDAYSNMLHLEEVNRRQYATIMEKCNDIRALQDSINKQNVKIDQQTNELISKEKEINDLKERVNDLKSDIKINGNINEKRIDTLKKSIVDKLKVELRNEIEGLVAISEHISDSDAKRLNKRIERINKILDEEE